MRKNSRLRGWVWLVWLLVPVLLLVGCRRGGGSRPHGGSGDSVTSGRTGGGGPGIGDLPVPDFGSSSGGYDSTSGGSGSSSGGISSGGSSSGSGSSGGSSSGGSAGTGGAPTPEPTDPTEEELRAMSKGTCLPIHRDGKQWNFTVLPDPVSCRSDRAGLFQVTNILTSSTSCPNGVGQDSWSYHSSRTGNTTTLCFNRVWVKNYCVLAEGSRSGVSSIGSTTAVDCYATRVPVPYNQILAVAGVYSVPASGADTSNCRTGRNDNRTYWSLFADNGATLVCFSVPN